MAKMFSISSTYVVPGVTGVADLGTSALKWKDIYSSGTVYLAQFGTGTLFVGTYGIQFWDANTLVRASAQGYLTLTAANQIDLVSNVKISAKNIITDTTTGIRVATATNQKISFWNAAPIVQPTALTAQITSLTYSEPTTPDYAIQDLTNSSPYGFVTVDEGQTTLKVISNLQVRVAELETKLQACGLIA